MVRKLMRQTTQKVNKHWHGRKGWEKESNTCVRPIFIFIKSFFSGIGGVIVSILASSVVDREFTPQSGQTKDYEIGICCFSNKYAAFRRKSKDRLARNQDNVSEWGDMSFRRL